VGKVRREVVVMGLSTLERSAAKRSREVVIRAGRIVIQESPLSESALE
jgi:hypothetical protein